MAFMAVFLLFFHDWAVWNMKGFTPHDWYSSCFLKGHDDYNWHFILWHWDLNSGATPWTTPLALFCDGFCFFWDRVLQNYLPGLALKHNLPDLCLLSN
jgi:hypothetical protein